MLLLVVFDHEEHGFVGLLSRIEHGVGFLSCFIHGQMVAGFLRPAGDPRLVLGHQGSHFRNERGLGLVVARSLLHRLLNRAESGVQALSRPCWVRGADDVLALHAFAEGFYALEGRPCFGVVGVSLGLQGRDGFAELVPLALGARGELLGGLQFLSACIQLIGNGFRKPFAAMKHQPSQEFWLDLEESVDVHARWAHTNPCKGSPAGRSGVKVKNPAGKHKVWVSVLGADSCLR